MGARPSSRELLSEAVANSRAALEEARSARLTAESIRAELRSYVVDDENHRGRATRIALLTLALLVLSAWLILHGAAGLEPLQHLLFMMAPTMIQCFPSLVEELDVQPRRAEGPHAAVDSCHMWRADGPLLKSGVGL